MSQQRRDDTPRDWRRRRGRDRQGDGGGQPGADTEAQALEEQSRTLFSFIEPAFDFVAVFYAPILIAGVIGLITGLALLLFVESLRLSGWIVLGIGGALALLVALSYFSQVIAAFFSRTGRYGVNTVVMTGAFIGLVVLVNYVAFENHFRVDTTATNQFSLADRTEDLLDNLDLPIDVIAYYPDEITLIDMLERREKVDTMLSEFSKRSGNFSYQFIDPQKEADLARSQGVTSYETIAVSAVGTDIIDLVQRPATDEKYSRLEQDLYTALLVASGKEQKKVYFLAGHGERDIDREAEDGYLKIRQGLEVDNYAVETLPWSPEAQDVVVPDDAALVVIAGPLGTLPESHAESLNLFVAGRNSDGSVRREASRLIVLTEPDTHASFRQFLATWGILIPDGYIRDEAGSQPNAPRTLRINNYTLPERNEISRILESLQGTPQFEEVRNALQAMTSIVQPRGVRLSETFMPGASALVPLPDPSGSVGPIPIALTSPASSLIDDIERTEPVEGDPVGPFAPAVFLPISIPGDQGDSVQIANVIVFGDSDFISNENVSRGSGAALFLNSANYLMGDYSLVSIRNREFVFREWNLDANEFNFVRFSTWLLLPGLMGMMAVVVWWVRR